MNSQESISNSSNENTYCTGLNTISISTNFIKEITGNDIIIARPLYDNVAPINNSNKSNNGSFNNEYVKQDDGVPYISAESNKNTNN